ncbi:FAD-dependent oxidoreductase [Rouxiella sp. T17]|uniref:FAD-dependent oxidoreductase n=1 Tax=Rouxiella sp. T17 TaxID=3085684 RepID=UPI002FC9BAA0
MSQLKIAVIGLGAIGSATLLALARLGIKAEGFEQYRVGHEFGASGGKTRQFRFIYGEGDVYTPLLKRSRALWQQLEQEAEQPLFYPCGFLTIGTPDSPWFQACLQSAQQQGLPHSVLSREDIAQWYPRLNLDADEIALHDPAGAILLTHQTIMSSVRRAEALGARVNEKAKITGITQVEQGIHLEVNGDVLHFDRVLVTTGAWVRDILPATAVASRRLGMTFHLAEKSGFDIAQFPAVMRVTPGRAMWNTQPMPDGQSFKFFVGDAEIDEQKDPSVRAVSGSAALSETIIERIDRILPEAVNGAERAIVGGATYPEAYTFDQAPILGNSADKPDLFLGVGLSGHGFKLSPALGELLAQAVTGRIDLASEWPLFDPERSFAEPTAAYSR